MKNQNLHSESSDNLLPCPTPTQFVVRPSRARSTYDTSFAFRFHRRPSLTPIDVSCSLPSPSSLKIYYSIRVAVPMLLTNKYNDHIRHPAVSPSYQRPFQVSAQSCILYASWHSLSYLQIYLGKRQNLGLSGMKATVGLRKRSGAEHNYM